MFKRFFRWFRLHFHTCSGNVLSKVPVTASVGNRLGFRGQIRGMVYICRCDVCGEQFALFESASGTTKINVSLDYALVVARG